MCDKKRFQKVIHSQIELESIVGKPSELVKRKVIHSIDQHCKDFINKSPFVILSTADDAGFCDGSPRGDMPGFVKIINENCLVIPDRPGNKRMDSMRNIIANPKIGLLFIIPGLGETLRINGSAQLIQDEEILQEMAVKGKIPKIAIAVEVEECFIHCAKAFKRSGLWQPDTWLDSGDVPSAAKILNEHARLPDYTVEKMEARLEKGYMERLY
ncbi:pyridoxamine 5'-phosphate oxidase family protein [Jeotgalibacillus sp. S-D1]|uniref:pyridoxamine 5'-phosphate oxidase family protein n=1 Tax=Jeotgalibacillus sp. S-D1 TaxID=2552189 RepID=UPI00105A27D4|nr:pyridoxamine 5'-phosphate oxidase family protein [Jeotgalibacillus sp. S-D1]TDL31384.1 pyridoxamine 5'-phosphate oxidase family protein [Jeotgalibacillus sp. S-D1]